MSEASAILKPNLGVQWMVVRVAAAEDRLRSQKRKLERLDLSGLHPPKC